MNSILGAIVWNMRDRRLYLSGVPDRGWGFVTPYVALVGATEHGISPEVAEHPEAERGFMLLRASGRLSSVVRHKHGVWGGWWGGLRSLVFSSIGPSRNRSKSITRSRDLGSDSTSEKGTSPLP